MVTHLTLFSQKKWKNYQLALKKYNKFIIFTCQENAITSANTILYIHIYFLYFINSIYSAGFDVDAAGSGLVVCSNCCCFWRYYLKYLLSLSGFLYFREKLIKLCVSVCLYVVCPYVGWLMFGLWFFAIHTLAANNIQQPPQSEPQKQQWKYLLQCQV